MLVDDRRARIHDRDDRVLDDCLDAVFSNGACQTVYSGSS